MTGTGTQSEPYMIEDIYDFCAIGDSTAYPTPEGESYVYFQFNNDIDFNDHSEYKTGISNKNIFNREGAIINGNGHRLNNMILRNYTSNNIQAIRCSEFKNIDFCNLILLSCTYKTFYCRNGKINNCNFGVFVSGTYFLALIPNDTTFNDCSFNIKGNFSQMETGTSVSFIRTRLNFDITIFNKEVGILKCNNSYSTYSTLFDNSYITGKIVNTASSMTNSYLFLYTNWKNSYVAIKFESPNLEKTFGFLASGTVSSASFIDVELFGGKFNTNSSTSNLYQLTTEQATNAEYLQSIGFPVISE